MAFDFRELVSASSAINVVRDLGALDLIEVNEEVGFCQLVGKSRRQVQHVGEFTGVSLLQDLILVAVTGLIDPLHLDIGVCCFEVLDQRLEVGGETIVLERPGLE